MEATKVTPDVLMQMQFAMAATRVLAVSTQLAIFTHVAEGKKSVAAIARAAGASERGTTMLLDSLCAFQLLAKKGASYELTPVSAEFLVRGKPSYMGFMIESDRMWDSWAHLGDSVRSGKPVVRVEDQKGAEDFFPALVRSLHVINREPARNAAKVLGGKRVLDVAAGSGVWGIAVAEAHPDARVTAQDFPGVLPVTKELVKKHGLEARFDYLPGDLKTVDYGTARFDLAILGNIVHSEGERSSRALLGTLPGARAGRPSRDRGHDPERRAHGASLPRPLRAQHAPPHRGGLGVHARGVQALAHGGGLRAGRDGRHWLPLAARDRNEALSRLATS